MAKQICSKCGYEGRGRRIGERKGGGITRVLGILTMLPFHTIWSLCGGKSGKQCPNCALPTMVKYNSDAGRLARHMLDVELGFIQPKPEVKKEAVVFGNERVAVKNVAKKPVNPEEW